MQHEIENPHYRSEEELLSTLKPLLQSFPESVIHGRDFLKEAVDIARMVTQKNNAYGDSYAKAKDFLKILYPNGVTVDSYHDMLILVRLFDKMMRIATDRDALGESPYRDVAGYAIVELTRQREEYENAHENKFSYDLPIDHSLCSSGD